MTNNELLHASLLDILFDGRNKDYGAYTLRRDYNQRLLLALGLGLSIILLFIFMNLLNKNNGYDNSQPKESEPDFNITELQTEPDKLLQPQKPKPPIQKPIEDIATIKNSTYKFVDEDLTETEVPTEDMIMKNAIGTETKAGSEDIGVLKIESPTNGANNSETVIVPEVIKPSSPPEFPGGFEALRKYLSRNLNTPEELETGETKMVKARFVVDKDGSVSTIEIILSGGTHFDKEVIRVCKKMPKWRPAIQNGIPVTTNYILPVTFISIEQ